MKRSGFKLKSHKPLKRSRIKTRKFSKVPVGEGASERSLRDEMDQIVREIIKLRDKKCVTFDCPRTEGLQVSHYIKRGVLALRWSLQNCNGACDSCNERHNTDQAPYKNAMILRYGIGVTRRIEFTAKENPRLEYSDLLAIRDGLLKELQNLKS